MINYEYRTIAKNVAAGCPVSELGIDVDERGGNKAYAYGVVAKALSRLVIPTVGEVLAGGQPNGVDDVTWLLSKELKSRSWKLLENDGDLEAELDDAMRTRGQMIQAGKDIKNPALANLRAGINTAMEIETTTLATIQRFTNGGQDITKEGVRKSQRVPFAFAMQSILDLDLSNRDMVERVSLPTREGRGELSEIVFHPSVVKMSPTKGLYLTRSLPSYTGHSRFNSEPTVTCPATLVKDFVYDLHAVASDACVESGVIKVSDY